MSKIKCIEITLLSKATSYVARCDDEIYIEELRLFVETGIGESLLFELIEIEEKELDNMPEFTGWENV